MAVYGFRNNSFSADKITGNEIDGVQVDVSKLNVNKQAIAKGVSYIKLESNTVGTVITHAYLYLGSAGTLRLASNAPVGTTGGFANVGAFIATVA
jgi:hypothetical protein